MPAAEEQTEKQSPSRSKGKTIGIVAVVLFIEAVVIIGAVMYFVGPSSVEATHMPSGEIADEDRIVETLILDAKLPNNRTGVTYLYDTEVYVQTKRRHTERVRRELEQFHNEIRAELTAIWRTAEPYHFQEPRLENLTRKVCAMLNGRFGVDPRTQEPIVEQCVIVMGTGFRIDS
jgi:flagellar basal body-associated protein FliL